MKDKVLIEDMEENRVGIYLYDEHTKTAISIPVEICHRYEAYDKYEVVGEMLPSGPSMFTTEYADEEEDDYTLEDFNLVEEDD